MSKCHKSHTDEIDYLQYTMATRCLFFSISLSRFIIFTPSARVWLCVCVCEYTQTKLAYWWLFHSSHFFNFIWCGGCAAIYSFFSISCLSSLLYVPRMICLIRVPYTNIKISHKCIDWPYMVYVCDQCALLFASTTILVSVYAATHHILLLNNLQKQTFFPKIFEKFWLVKFSIQNRFKFRLKRFGEKNAQKKLSNVKTIKKSDKLLIFLVVVVGVCGNLIVSSQSINFAMEHRQHWETRGKKQKKTHRP